MTSASPAASASPKDAVFSIFIRGTADAVWREITKTDEPQQTFFNMWMETTTFAPGAPIRMRTKSRKYTGAVGEVLEWDPPRRFAHTFRFTQFDDPECIVRYEIEDAEGGVNFRMTLENLPDGTKTAKQMRQGGTMIVKTLKSMVESGKPSFGTRVLFRVFGLLEPLSPKSTRSEHWPL